jgi:hypothetical protein
MQKLTAKLLLVCLLAAGLAFPQADANRGQILGTVTDASGAAVPGAKVRAENQATGLVREVQTNESGLYRILQLDPGSYQLVAESKGLAPATVKGLIVSVGSTVQADVTLQVQATTTTVDVGDSLINIALPAPTTSVNLNQIRDLPINGRRFQDFAAMTPTVQVEPQRQQLSFVGQKGIQGANVMLDGADYNQPFFGGIRGGERSGFNFTVPQSAIQEFQVITAGYAAEYGRSTGGVLNAITKTGTNALHGDAFWQTRRGDLSQPNPILGLKTSENLQQFGGSAGGRIIKDKLFWFGAIERQISEAPRQVLFPNLVGLAPTPDTATSLSFYRGLEVPFLMTNNSIAATARGDYQFAKGHRLAVRYNISDVTSNNGVNTGGALQPNSNQAVSNEGTEKDRTHTGTVQYTHLLSPSMVNDAKFGVTYELRPRLANSTATNLTASAVGVYGARSFLPTTQDDTRVQFADNLSVIKGNHTMKVGVDYSYLTTFQQFGFNQFGLWSLGGNNVTRILDLLSPGGSVANRFDSTTANEVIYRRQIGNLLANFNIHQIAFFAQDSWRVNKKLTLDFGLRYEAQLNPSPEANNTDLVNAVKNTVFPNGKRIDPTSIPSATNQWMPRFGFAFNPGWGRRTVFRGHTGIFYASTPMLLFAGPINNFRVPAGDVSLQLTSGPTTNLYNIFRTAGFDLNQGSLDNLPVIPLEVVQRAAALAQGVTTVDPFRGANVIAMAPDFKNPRAVQAGFGVESEIFKDFITGAQFHYVNAVNQQRNVDYNLPVPTIRATDGRTIYNRSIRPLPQYGTIQSRESSARSMYRAMSLQAQYRKSRYQFQAFYVLSESFSDDDNERDSGGPSAQDQFNFKPDYGYSRLDARHQVSANGLVDLPWGITASAIMRYRTGYPFNPITNTDDNGDTAFIDRPYRSVGVVFPRNYFRNNNFFSTDMRVMKSFTFKDRFRVQLSAEFFNLFNNKNIMYGFNGSQFNGVYGRGIDPTTGAVLPPDPSFMRLRLANGSYDTQNQQQGVPFSTQFGVRFFF